jgi:hypothetical protein
MMSKRIQTKVRPARPNEFEVTQPPANMPSLSTFVPEFRQRAEIVPQQPTAQVDPYAAHLPQPVQHVTRYDASPTSRAQAMVMKVHQVTIFLAIMTGAGMAVLTEWSFMLWLLFASLEWVAVFVVLAVIDYREQPSSQSRMVADRYIRMMEREQEARLRWQYGDDYDSE